MHSLLRKPIIVLVAIFGDTPIDWNCECLQVPWRVLAFREKALDSTPSARIVEHDSGTEPVHILNWRVYFPSQIVIYVLYVHSFMCLDEDSYIYVILCLFCYEI